MVILLFNRWRFRVFDPIQVRKVVNPQLYKINSISWQVQATFFKVKVQFFKKIHLLENYVMESPLF